MKLLTDLIPCQTQSRDRGIGRYTLEFTRALIDLRRDNEMVCMADPLLSDGYEELREEFTRRLPPGNFLPYFHESIPTNSAQYDIFALQAATLIRQAYQTATPDVVLTPSLFEGYGSPEIVVPPPLSKNQGYLQAVILYDLIPYIFRDHYLDPNPTIKSWYLNRLSSLQNFDLLLTISEATRQDAIKFLNLPQENVVNILGASSSNFRKIDIPPNKKFELLTRLDINRPFLFYLGGNDFRKNMSGALKAYALLPHDLINQHQLVVNDVGDETIFRKQARNLGLKDEDIIITGRISEDDLIMLYNLCKIFVFPSLYEGFGLPVLEAMCCGAPVLASNNSSLPEVVGRTDALFNANDPNSIATTINLALTNLDFRNELSIYGLENSKKFSWENSAKRAWQAIEDKHKHAQHRRIFTANKNKTTRPRIAFLSPLPPQQSGISEYSAQLLPYLGKFFEIDLYIEPGSLQITDSNLRLFPTYPSTELLLNRDQYATAVYHHGNSPFHAHMVSLEQKFPGVVVLHDFFISHLMQNIHKPENEFLEELDYSHGLKSLIDYQLKKSKIVWDWPINWRVLRYARELIVHSTYHQQLLNKYYRNSWQPRLNIINQFRNVEPEVDISSREKIRSKLGINKDDFVFCSFGIVSEQKMNDRIVEALSFIKHPYYQKCQLIFVGDCPDKVYLQNLNTKIQKFGLQDRVRITGYVKPEEYKSYLVSADAAIQLRQNSRGETSRAILDCMANGVPVIINAHGTNNDYCSDEVVKISNSASNEELCNVMVKLQKDEAFKLNIGKNGRKRIMDSHSPEMAASAYAEVIDRAIKTDDRIILKPIGEAPGSLISPQRLLSQSKLAAKNFSTRNKPRLLIDVSNTAFHDARSGIQRVVKSIVKTLLINDDLSLQIEPVKISDGMLIRASRFSEKILNLHEQCLGYEKEIKIQPGDSLVMLDSSWHLYDQFENIFNEIRKNGGKIITTVYDLIPIRYPSVSTDGILQIFEKWLNLAIYHSDILLCISKSTADDLEKYIIDNKIIPKHRLDVTFFHLGSDITISTNELFVNDQIKRFEHSLQQLFLMVGTLEPRKGHLFTLEAFELLWKQGYDYVLCFAGKIGWLSDDIEHKLRSHPEIGNRLILLEDPTDAEINMCYKTATALIAASTAEGFGLPIVEAALHKTPVIASDIPVFHEVGGENVVYFSLESPNNLSQAVKFMAEMNSEERLSLAKSIKVLTWKESAAWLMDVVDGKFLYKHFINSKN